MPKPEYTIENKADGVWVDIYTNKAGGSNAVFKDDSGHTIATRIFPAGRMADAIAWAKQVVNAVE